MANEYVSTLSNRIFIQSENDQPGTQNFETARLAPLTALQIRNSRKQIFRRDKTGYRGEQPVIGPQRELVEFKTEGYGTGWDGGAGKPAVSVLLESGLCAPTALGSAYPVQSVSGTNVTLSQDAMLAVGMGVSFGSEIRFIVAVLGARDFTLNAPFTVEVANGNVLDGCANVQPGDSARTMALLETWSPAEAVQRVMRGAVIDELTIRVNNDFLEIAAQGYAKSLTDSASSGGTANTVPPAPLGQLPAAPIAGHLGQVWMNSPAARVCTLTQAEIRIDNNIEPRTEEFGCYGAKDYLLGRRTVRLDLSLYGRNDELSHELYAKARNNEPVSVMLQIGNQPGSMFAVYLPAVLLPIPVFDDSDTRLLWRFRDAVALGLQNDEVFIAMR
jgi:hypothetical protein